MAGTGKRYWLLKCEPGAYSIDDLARDGTAGWEGVRNFQARNYLRDELEVGDGVLFYASNAEPSGVTGLAEVARAGYPDPFAFERGHKYHDPESDPERPTWYTVDIRFVERFPGIVPLATLKATPGLEDMVVTQKGSRLSVQPVTAREFEIVRRLGRAARPGASAAPESPRRRPRPAGAKAQAPQARRQKAKAQAPSVERSRAKPAKAQATRTKAAKPSAPAAKTPKAAPARAPKPAGRRGA